MAAEPQPKDKSLFVDMDMVRKAIAKHNAEIGFVPGPPMTPKQLRDVMRAEGIRPEDNECSRGIIAMRDEE